MTAPVLHVKVHIAHRENDVTAKALGLFYAVGKHKGRDVRGVLASLMNSIELVVGYNFSIELHIVPDSEL